MDYQRLLVILPLFGWLRSTTQMRRFRFLFLFVPKGNGKSPIGSGIGLYLTLCDDQAGAEVFAIAGDKLQAKVVHGDAKVMVEESADLQELCEVTRDSIYCPQSRSSYQVLSADAPGKHGRRPHGVIVDELHNQPNRDLFEAFRKSMIKGDQPALVMLSHAGTDEESICYEEYEYAKAVIKDPAYDESYLPVVFEATPEDDWTSPDVWRKANPAFGITINEEIFAAECNAARNNLERKTIFFGTT
jgi:phage terminase large subunit-like protein